MRTIRFTLAAAVVSALLALMSPVSSLAGGATTDTTTKHNATDTFIDVAPCVGSDYQITVTYNEVDHVTYAPNGSFHATFTQTGTFEAVPASDSSLPTYSGHFTQWGGLNGNQQSTATTFTFTVKGTGSDGSRIDFHLTEHLTVNANGTITSDFSKASC